MIMLDRLQDFFLSLQAHAGKIPQTSRLGRLLQAVHRVYAQFVVQHLDFFGTQAF